jgi:hypothetical protein
MVALIAAVAIAEVLQGEAAVVADSHDTDPLARLNLARRIAR